MRNLCGGELFVLQRTRTPIPHVLHKSAVGVKLLPVRLVARCQSQVISEKPDVLEHGGVGATVMGQETQKRVQLSNLYQSFVLRNTWTAVHAPHAVMAKVAGVYRFLGCWWTVQPWHKTATQLWMQATLDKWAKRWNDHPDYGSHWQYFCQCWTHAQTDCYSSWWTRVVIWAHHCGYLDSSMIRGTPMPAPLRLVSSPMT